MSTTTTLTLTAGLICHSCPRPLTSMSTLLFVLAMIVGPQTTQHPWPELAPEERAVLEDLYRATGGESWKDRQGWNSAAIPCEWSGVVCDVDSRGARINSVVRSLNLPANHLRGVLPESLARLAHLQRLDVSGNELTGAVPEALLQRWDRNDLEFIGYGNGFTNLLSTVSVRVSASSLLYGVDEDVRFMVEVRADGAARFESIRCEPGTRRTYCAVREGRGPDLTRASRTLELLRFRELADDYDYRFGFTTHGTYSDNNSVVGQW